MNHQHSSRNYVAKGSMVKQTSLYTLILVICIWLLYQMKHSLYLSTHHDCNDIGSKFKEDYVGLLLGRKVDAGFSYNAKEYDLYGMDMIGAAETIKDVAADVNKSGDNTAEKNGEQESIDNSVTALVWRALGESSTKEDVIPKKIESIDDRMNDQGIQSDDMERTESELKSMTEENKANTSKNDEDETLISGTHGDEDEKVSNGEGTELKSTVSIGAVILNSNGISRVVQFNDENGVPEHDSTSSHRSDIQVESLPEENISSTSNQSREMESCKQICAQGIAQKKSLIKFGHPAVHDEEAPEMMVVKPRKGSRREILFTERWLNNTRL